MAIAQNLENMIPRLRENLREQLHHEWPGAEFVESKDGVAITFVDVVKFIHWRQEPATVTA